MSVLTFRTTHTSFCCQANSKAPKLVGQVFPYAACNNHSRLLFCFWTDPLWSWCYSFEKFNCKPGLIRSIECSSQGVWVAEVSPTERVDEFPHATLFGSMKWWQNHFDVTVVMAASLPFESPLYLPSFFKSNGSWACANYYAISGYLDQVCVRHNIFTISLSCADATLY